MTRQNKQRRMAVIADRVKKLHAEGKKEQRTKKLSTGKKGLWRKYGKVKKDELTI